MKTINLDSTSCEEQQYSGGAIVLHNLEYFLLLIPFCTALIGQRYPNSSHLLNGGAAVVLLILPILICLVIITVRYRKHKIRAVVLRYATVGLIVPPLIFFSYVASLVLGWMKDDGSFGWLIIMAIPAAMASSVITTFIGAVMLLVAKIIQWGVNIARFQ
jgi:hypothetical protein